MFISLTIVTKHTPPYLCGGGSEKDLMFMTAMLFKNAYIQLNGVFSYSHYSHSLSLQTNNSHSHTFFIHEECWEMALLMPSQSWEKT